MLVNTKKKRTMLDERLNEKGYQKDDRVAAYQSWKSPHFKSSKVSWMEIEV